MKKILVLFKTHLDVGFTDLAGNIVKKYNEEYIPASLRVAEELAEKGYGFIWTTGSWLIDQYLRNADDGKTAVIENAIKNRRIRWHGLPFTTHTEVATKELFEYGLSLSQNLDKKYGIKTIAAKMTDVPGHTRALVPLLAKAGIEFLHIGVNPAAAAPDIPDFFRWRHTDGSEITVMYNKGDYGEFSVIPGTETGVYFAHTGDNRGPSSAEDVIAVYEKLKEQYPNAEIIAADLNDLAEAVRPVKEYLPVITSEIGDTWIHGAGTDPKKVNIYRALLRLASAANEADKNAIYNALLLIPEHTWGVSIRTWLHDFSNYSREKFEPLRNEGNYKISEYSWAEQRAYLDDAINGISDPKIKEAAIELTKQYKTECPDFSKMQRVENEFTANDGWKIKWDKKGIYLIEKGGKIYCDNTHRVGSFCYQAYSDKDTQEYMDRYMKPAKRHEFWVIGDNIKPGLDKDMTEHYFCNAEIESAYTDGFMLYFKYTTDKNAFENYGYPEKLYMSLQFFAEGIVFDFGWSNKPACRIPEALWLGFSLTKPLTAITKLGSEINPLEVVSLGNRELHATEGTLKFCDIKLETVDTPLLSVEKPQIYGFYNKLPDTSKGVWFNLFNNQWGTNFPQWYDDDARFRFVLYK